MSFSFGFAVDDGELDASASAAVGGKVQPEGTQSTAPFGCVRALICLSRASLTFFLTPARAASSETVVLTTVRSVTAR